jgi:hypothetical protein
MRNSNQSFIRTACYNVFILAFLFLLAACNNSPSEDKTSKNDTDKIAKVKDILWNVKAIHPDGQTLAIKAFNKEGKTFDIKAIQNSDQDSFLDVKAMVDGKELPLKFLVSDRTFIPVKAIDRAGVSYDIKAITATGEKLDVKGIGRYGNIVIMKAITKEGKFYGVKAVSPTGQLNDIKGIKINIKEKEMTLKGFSVHAHVVAMHPAANEDDFKVPPKKKKKKGKGKSKNNFKRIIWNIKAVTALGENLDVKAVDDEGNSFDVKVTQDSKQHSFMNIKAFVNGDELPVKIIDSLNKYAPVRAIGRGGVNYNIKAITAAGVKLDIKGISRSGNIVHVKAINKNGEFYGVKAFAPGGKLNEVKGIKIFERRVELKIQGNPVYAHLKAINQ